MFVQFRPFRAENLKEIIELTKNNLSERYSEFIFMDIQKSWPAGFIVSIADNHVVGFMCGGITGNKEARILMIAVDRYFRNKGIGTGLMTLFEQEALKIKVNRIRLEVRIDNMEAISFYKIHGYKVVNLLPSYYNDGFDAYTMEKFIAVF